MTMQRCPDDGNCGFDRHDSAKEPYRTCKARAFARSAPFAVASAVIAAAPPRVRQDFAHVRSGVAVEYLEKSREWSDPPKPGRDADDWPYPDKHVESVATGEFGDAIRARFGVTDASVPVEIHERRESGGWSEYTQETEYHFTVKCGEHERVFEDANGLVEVIRWLDEGLAPSTV